MSVALEGLLPLLLQFPGLGSIADSGISLETQVTTWSIVLSFVVAAATGVVFGIYPAIVASRQDPIVALRHD